MDIVIKQEPFEDIYQNPQQDQIDSNLMENCCLCQAGKIILSEIVEHFQTYHSEVLTSPFTKFCNCTESFLLQARLTNHLLSHVFSTSEQHEERDFLAINIKVDPDEQLMDKTIQESSNRVTVGSPFEIFPNKNLLEEIESAASCLADSTELRKSRKQRTRRPNIANEFTFNAESAKFVCNFCCKSYGNKSSVRQHIQEKHSGGLSNDSEQNYSKESSRLDFDWESKESFPMEKAKKERKKRTRRPSIANDFTHDYHIKKFICNRCPRQFTQKSAVRLHLHEKHAEPTVEASQEVKERRCELCRREFSSTEEFDQHWESEHRQESLQCKECVKLCTSAKQLYYHAMTHREKNLVCDECGKMFNSKQKLLRHLLMHSGVPQTKISKKAMCELCSMMVGRDRMKQHLLRHSSDRPFKCDEPGCQSAFKDSRTLREHKHVHSEEKPFRCEFCDERFKRSSCLRSHRLRHTNPDRFKCSVCGECFVNTLSLKKHKMRIHSVDNASPEARPFACDYEGCLSTFRFHDFLVAHKREVHNKKRIKMSCEFCSFVSDTRKNYNQHRRRAHGVIKNKARVFDNS